MDLEFFVPVEQLDCVSLARPVQTQVDIEVTLHWQSECSKLHRYSVVGGMPTVLRGHDWTFKHRWPMPTPNGGHATQVLTALNVT